MRLLPSIAILAISAASVNAALVVPDTSTITINFDNLNTNFGGAYNATGGSSLFPSGSGSGSLPTPVTIYSGTGGPAFTFSNGDFNPGGVYSNTGSYSNSNSARALQNGSTSDLAFGTKDSSDRSFILTIENGSAQAWQSVTIGYAVEQYSIANSATTMNFGYSLNGSNFSLTNFTGGEVVTASTNGATADTNLASVASTARSATITETIQPGEKVYIRWFYDHASDTSVHLGLDDITITAAIPEPASLGLLGLAGLAMGRRRR